MLKAESIWELGPLAVGATGGPSNFLVISSGSTTGEGVRPRRLRNGPSESWQASGGEAYGRSRAPRATG